LSSLRLEAFAQATRTVSLKLGSLAWASTLQWHSANSRLGETLSLERYHSSLKTKVPRLATFQAKNIGFTTSSRLGEALSPEWDGLSLKTRSLRLSEMLEQNYGEFLLLSPRRDELACARILVLVIVHACRVETQHKATFKNASKPFSPDQ